MELLEFGFINNTRGLKGELKVTALCDYKEQYEEVDYIYIDNKEYEIEYVKYHKEQVILKLFDIDTIEKAEIYKSKTIFVSRDELPKLEDGVYYIVDLLGSEGKFIDGSSLGKLVEVLQNGPIDLYEFKDENNKSVLIPKVDEYVAGIDIDNKIINLKDKSKDLIF